MILFIYHIMAILSLEVCFIEECVFLITAGVEEEEDTYRRLDGSPAVQETVLRSCIT